MPRLEVLEGRALLSTTFTVINLADNGTGSLRQAIHDANATPGADVINFAPKLHGTIKLTSVSGQLDITDSLTISGPGANLLTISGNNTSRVFDISGHVTVTIAGLTIANGLATSTGIAGAQLGGGGILNEADATLNLTSCVVVNNKAYAGSGLDVFGGGLLNLGKANVTYSTFTGNQVLDGTGPSKDFFGGSVGGAIDNFGGATLTVTNSTFINNQAIGAAGGFYGIGGAIENNAGFKSDSTSTAKISCSIFQSNVAKGDAGSLGNGGAIANEGTGANMILNNSSLIANQSIGGDGAHGLGGGIINAQGSTLNVTNSTFIGNQAIGGKSTPSNPTTFAFGGGINNTSAGLTVSDSSLFGNEALSLSPGGVAVGGGIENGSYYPGEEKLELTNCTLSGNQAICGAGGAAAGGGLDNSFGATATIEDSQIINNQALGGAGGPGVVGGAAVGGGISVGSSTLPAFGSPDDASSLTVTDSTIAGNLARGGNGGSGTNGGNGLGGGIWFGLPTSPPPLNSIDNSVITGNFALGGRAGAGAGGSDGQGRGGGLYIDGATVHATRTLIKKNSASNHLYNDLFGTLS